MIQTKVLFIATSHTRLGDTPGMTGVWLEEIAAPYFVFMDAEVGITLASPKGGQVPLDPKSQSIIVATNKTKRFLKDEEAMSFLAHSEALENVKADDFHMVFITGGHGAMWDIAHNETVKKLLEDFQVADKPIGAVCHGVAALLTVKNEQGGSFVKNKRLTAFSNNEETSSRLEDTVPFLLETELGLLGAVYSQGAKYTSHVVVDQNLVTGQNPASSEEVAKQLLKLLKTQESRALAEV
jgi:putative intracellular protease/amidase